MSLRFNGDTSGINRYVAPPDETPERAVIANWHVDSLILIARVNDAKAELAKRIKMVDVDFKKYPDGLDIMHSDIYGGGQSFWSFSCKMDTYEFTDVPRKALNAANILYDEAHEKYLADLQAIRQRVST